MARPGAVLGQIRGGGCSFAVGTQTQRVSAPPPGGKAKRFMVFKNNRLLKVPYQNHGFALWRIFRPCALATWSFDLQKRERRAFSTVGAGPEFV